MKMIINTDNGFGTVCYGGSVGNYDGQGLFIETGSTFLQIFSYHTTKPIPVHTT